MRVIGNADKREALLVSREGNREAISVPVYLLPEEAGGAAGEECEGRRRRKIRAAEESHMKARCLSMDGGHDDSASLVRSQTTS